MWSPKPLARQGSLRFGGFVLSRRPLALFRDGRMIELTSQPLCLLQLLVENAGQTVTHAQIREALWTDRTVSFSGSTHVSVRRIRAALGDDTAEPRFIETLPREGYRFVAQVRSDAAGRLALTALGTGLAAAASLVIAVLYRPDTGTLPPPVEAVRLGEYLLTQVGNDAAERSLAEFEAALEADPDDPRALAGAARSALRLQDFARADSFAAQAIGIAPDNASALEVRGHVAMMRDHDWAAARRDFEAALDRAPDFAPAHHSMATLLVLSGEFDNALAHMDEARRLDPASTLIRADLGWMQYYAGRHAAAAANCERAIALEPDLAAFRYCVIRAAQHLSDADRARPHIAWVMEHSGSTADEIDTVIGHNNLITAFDRWRYDRYVAADRAEPVPALVLAFAAVLAGETDVALDALEDAEMAGDPGLPFAFVDPAFRALHGDDRYEGLRSRTSPQPWSTGEITDRSGLRAVPSR